MPRNRHPLFQHLAMALTHQHNDQTDLALAYWEQVLRRLPDDLPIHDEILAVCGQLAQGDESGRRHQKVAQLTAAYRQDIPADAARLWQQVYHALMQQINGNHALALAYWKNALPQLTGEAYVMTLAVQDFCWIADQTLHAGDIKRCFDIYARLLRVFPDFIEGFVNVSLLEYAYGERSQILAHLTRLPPQARGMVIAARYRELFRKIAELSQYFEHIPYVAIEAQINHLRLENTFYPAINEDYFTAFVTDVIEREQRFFEKRRKSAQEKALLRTSKRIAKEGLALGQRVTLAKQARSEEIARFLYDNDVHIAEALLNNPHLGAEDVLVMAQTCAVGEVLHLIAESRKWGALHPIVMAVIMNPQTLPPDAVRLLALLEINDLAKVFYRKTLATEVRLRAKQTLQQRFARLRLGEQIAVIEVSRGELTKLLDMVAANLTPLFPELLRKCGDQPDILVNLCRWALTPPHILTEIADLPDTAANMTLVFALLTNPRTPEAILSDLVQTISTPNLRDLLANRYLPETVKHIILALFPQLAPSPD